MAPRHPLSVTARRGAAGALILLLVLLGLGTTATAASAQVTPVPTVSAVAPVKPVTPVAPSASTSPAPGLPALTDGKGGVSSPVSLVLLLGALSVVPALLICVTAFTRIVVVLGLTRSALGTNGVPPTQVLIGLALFLTLFVMGPQISKANEDAVQPFLKGDITQAQAFERGIEPFREFMLKNTREKDLALFVELSKEDAPATPEDVPTTTLVPAFVISELRAAFLIGFVVFLPFIVIDLVVAAALSALGMAMLPPSLVSLPFKLLLFVAVDGWFLLASSLVRSFH